MVQPAVRGDWPCVNPGSSLSGASSSDSSTGAKSATKTAADSPSIIGPLTNNDLPRNITRKAALDLTVLTAGRTARLQHQTLVRMRSLKLVGPDRETVPQEKDPPAIQLLIALANAAAECATAEAGDSGNDLDRRKAMMTGFKSAIDAVQSIHGQILAMTRASTAMVQETKRMAQQDRQHEERLELQRRALALKPGKTSAADILDDALQTMSDSELARFRVTSEDTTVET